MSISCGQCNGPGGGGGGRTNRNQGGKDVKDVKCCWEVSLEIEKFRRRAFRLYIVEALFDMLISITSVVVDLATVIVYFQKEEWIYACLTGLPILLPTIVFTNIYLKDETQGVKGRQKQAEENDAKVVRVTEQPKVGNDDGVKEQEEGGRFFRIFEERTKVHKIGISNCVACLGGILHSLFHKDRRIRERGAKMAKKSMGRMAKYLFGTLVLRFIAWTWYLKALVFGFKAYRQPKKYMKMELPEVHWSHDLLVRLDFFQAAMENAPQCVIQLYALITQPNEDQTLGILALTFSFIDFVRVTTTVLWNIDKGPVVAPENCYGTLIWQIMNVTSWICLYVARCCAMSLVIGTAFAAKGATLLVPIVAAVAHIGLFAYLISRNKGAGQASQKLAVTIFISIFFLPDLDSKDVHVTIQFYYGMTLLENIFFIIPWGFDLSFTGYCFVRPIGGNGTTAAQPIGQFLVDRWVDEVETNDVGPKAARVTTDFESDCMIDPVIIVLMVPALTILGLVFRLAAAQKMSRFKAVAYQNRQKFHAESAHGHGSEGGGSIKMEDKVAKIYGKKWAKMTMREMWTAFLRMLHKEVTPPSSGNDVAHDMLAQELAVLTQAQLKDESQVGGVVVVENDFQAQFRAAQSILRKSFALVWTSPYNNDSDHFKFGADEKKRDNILTPNNEDGHAHQLQRQRDEKNQMNFIRNDFQKSLRRSSVPAELPLDKLFDQESNFDLKNFLRGHPINRRSNQLLLDVRFLRVETKEGEAHVFKTIQI